MGGDLFIRQPRVGCRAPVLAAAGTTGPRFLILLCGLLWLTSASPALACDQCARANLAYEVPFLPAWVRIFGLWLLVAGPFLVAGGESRGRTAVTWSLVAMLAWFTPIVMFLGALVLVPLFVALPSSFMALDDAPGLRRHVRWLRLFYALLLGMFIFTGAWEGTKAYRQGIRYHLAATPRGTSLARTLCKKAAQERLLSTGTLLEMLASKNHAERQNGLQVIEFLDARDQENFVPQLIRFLDQGDEEDRSQSQRLLSGLAGRDLGSTPQPWQAWWSGHPHP